MNREREQTTREHQVPETPLQSPEAYHIMKGEDLLKEGLA
jgi:hypothetical protein